MSGSPFQGNLNAIDPGSPIGRMVRGIANEQYRPPLTEQERRDAREIAKTETCRWCGGIHARACPRVKAMTFHTDGMTVLSVEFWPPNTWPTESIIWPEDLETEDTEGGDA